MGGTTTDLGVIQHGFPRESGVAVTIGGVRTNFRMPDVVSIGLGGGSIVRQQPDGTVTVGPDSVGYRITEEALCFGGAVCTATDIAVRLGMTELGDREKVMGLDEGFARKALAAITTLAEDALDAMKVSAGDVDVILVGGRLHHPAGEALRRPQRGQARRGRRGQRHRLGHLQGVRHL